MLFLHSGRFLLVNLGQQAQPLGLCKISLGFDLPTLGFGLEPGLLVLLPQLCLHCGHLFRAWALLDDHLTFNDLLDNLVHILNLLLHARWQWHHGDIASFAIHSASCFQFRLEAVNLLLVLPDHGILRILIDAGLVFDALGAVRVPQRRHSFVIVVVSRPNVCHHHSLGVATKRVLEQPGELRVSVRNVRGLPIHEGRDHIPEGGKREVDLCGLFEALASGTCLALTLRASQVHHVQFSYADMAFAIHAHRTLFHRNHENGVRTRRRFVHLSGTDGPIRKASLEDLVHLSS
mmetsp:Transcript_1282/g.3028  ORF Transcript_1282/g.3028 Transcript_1282/m.3028 type:complete len:291 (-) Transcript_1282:645-1517(-)